MRCSDSCSVSRSVLATHAAVRRVGARVLLTCVGPALSLRWAAAWAHFLSTVNDFPVQRLSKCVFLNLVPLKIFPTGVGDSCCRPAGEGELLASVEPALSLSLCGGLVPCCRLYMVLLCLLCNGPNVLFCSFLCLETCCRRAGEGRGPY